MNVKRFVIGCVVTYVVAQALGFLIHTVFLGETYGSMAEVWRPEAEMMAKTWVMFLTSMLWTALFCYIFTRGYEDRGVAEGIRYGFLIGLFWLPVAYENHVIFPIPISLAHIWWVTRARAASSGRVSRRSRACCAKRRAVGGELLLYPSVISMRRSNRSAPCATQCSPAPQS